MNERTVKEAIRDYMLIQPDGKNWEPPLLDSLSLRAWVGMLYDGLAYGNWPWVNENLTC